MTTLVLWRHAVTPDNRDKRLQGLRDTELDGAGVAQARRAARALRSAHPEIAAIHSSPLARATATAHALSALIDIEVAVTPHLTQRSYGIWEGLTWEEVARDFPLDYALRMRNEDPTIEGWEFAADVAARVHGALANIALPGTTTVAVSHGSSLSLGMLSMLGMNLHSTALARLRHAHWAVLVQRPDEGWQLRAFNIGTD